MNRKTSELVLSILIIATSVSATIGQTDVWKSIKVMTSTREDVRKILGQSDQGRGSEVYSINGGTVDVEYSYGSCADKYNSGWNIPKDVVVRFRFTPLTNIKFTSLKLNRRKFEIIHESADVPNLITYIDRSEGVRFVVHRPDDLLQTVGFFPPARYENLRCELAKMSNRKTPNLR